MIGIICLDKPGGITSFSAVSRIKRVAGAKKAGHAGTLDPMATGVLPVLLGGAARFAEFLPTHDKAYRATVKLGLTSSTLDSTGEILSRSPVSAGKQELLAVLPRFRGEIMQTPPMVSAISKNGVRLYELARRGVEVEREPRKITIRSLELVSYDESKHEYIIDVTCSKGTYIRALAADIGEALGCGAVMSALRRTMAAGFTLDDCVTLEQAGALASEGRLAEKIIPIDAALGAYPRMAVTAAQAVRFKNGGALALERVTITRPSEYYRVYSDTDAFLGFGEIDTAKNELAVKRLMVE